MIKITISTINPLGKGVQDSIAEKIQNRLMPRLYPNVNFFICFSPTICSFHQDIIIPDADEQWSAEPGRLESFLVFEISYLRDAKSLSGMPADNMFKEVTESEFALKQYDLRKACEALKGIELELSQISPRIRTLCAN